MSGALAFMFTFATYAQQAEMTFEKDEHDFGLVREDGGAIAHEFVFINTGKDSLRISQVKASCGCTTPSWTKEAIAPGDTGRVTAQYSPLNRPGSFRKSVTVTANTEPSTRVLYIKGSVSPKPKTPAEDFPTAMGENLRVKYRSLNVGKVLTNEPITKAFEMYNDGPEPIVFADTNFTPGHIKVDIEPKELLPGQKGFIKINYDATHAVEANRLGFSTDQVRLLTNEADSIKDFTVMATVEEYFEPLDERELRKAPKIVFAKKQHDFGTIRQGEQATSEFTFSNVGKGKLDIRATKANCGCTVSKPDEDILKSGKSGTITVTFDSQGRRGKQQKTITVFSNDPLNPTQQLTITADVDAPTEGK